MFDILFVAMFSALTGNGSIFATKEQRKELKAVLKEAGITKIPDGDSGAWEKHLKAMEQPQPKEWR